MSEKFRCLLEKIRPFDCRGYSFWSNTFYGTLGWMEKQWCGNVKTWNTCRHVLLVSRVANEDAYSLHCIFKCIILRLVSLEKMSGVGRIKREEIQG